MTGERANDPEVRVRELVKEMAAAVSEKTGDRAKELARIILREPFAKRTWSEFWFLTIGIPLAGVGMAFVALTMFAGVILAITFFGLAIIALSVRGSRGLGGFHRQLARGLLNEEIDDPEPFEHRPGFFGWLQAGFRDRTGWRSMAYVVVKVPLALLGLFGAFAVWWSAFFCLTFPIWGGPGQQVAVFGLPRFFFGNTFFSGGQFGRGHGLGVFLAGLFFLFAAPWAVRAVVALDRRVMRVLLSPDPVAVRVRSLEEARAQTVDSSAAAMRRIERDLHDGTQAQLVALAMRLGMAKEKLADDDHLDLDQVRQLVNDAHRGAKEAIVELRDLARGIHPPALDIGLEGALATLAARCTVPTSLTLTLNERPTPAIEAIAYFCVAELLANVTQHAMASRASISCTESRWLAAGGRARRRHRRSLARPHGLLVQRIGRPD